MSTFTPRTYIIISDEMIAWLSANPSLAPGVTPATDFAVGSLERSHVEAVAVQIEELEARTAEAFMRAIQESCYTAFGFDLLPAQAAQGSVVFTNLAPGLSPISIPSGTKLVATNGQTFLTTADATITAGAGFSAAVSIMAENLGIVGNVGANTVTRLAIAIPGADLVTNASPVVGGADQESQAARAIRFNRFIQTLPRGTKGALEYAALSTGLITQAVAVEPFLIDPRPDGVPYAGLVWLFCDDGTGGLGSTAQTAVERVVNGYFDGVRNVPGWKAAGVIVSVLPIRILQAFLRGGVKLKPQGGARWAAIQTKLTDTVLAFFSTLKIGQPVSYQLLTTALNSCDSDIAEVDLYMWKPGDAVPVYGSTPQAMDVNPVDVAADPLTLGARAVPFQGVDSSVTYPEWVLVP